MSNNEIDAPNYLERSVEISKRSNQALADLIIDRHKCLKEDGKAVKMGLVDGVNNSREIGIYLSEWCGHEKLSLQFWKANCEKVLPFDFEAAKFFISISRKMPSKAKTLDDIEEHGQLFMVHSGYAELPKRAGIQHASTTPPLQKLACCFVMLQKPFQKIINASPMRAWDREDLKLFLSETDWLAGERDKAQKLLEGKK